MGRFLLGLAVALAAIAAPAGAGAAARADSCGSVPGLVCSDVVVPLDRSGVVPGTVTLHVESLAPATSGPSRGAIFLIAGGPGQGSAHVFDLADETNRDLFRFLFPGYTLVAYDDRGTGESGLLDCPALQAATTTAGEDQLAAACAASLGADAPFYGTADHVADLDAVRASVGFDRIALFGVSYGTKLALAYASAYPDHVSMLVLDSVLPPSLPDPFSANVLQAMPATLAAWCSGVCTGAIAGYPGDVTAVANKLAVAPLRGPVLQANGTTKVVKLDGVGVLSMVVDSDLNPALAAELPAAMHAARLGNVRPLLRLSDLDTEASQTTATDLSDALFAATVCRDGPFPWPADASPGVRSGLLSQAIAALPAGSFGPFGSYAAELGNADLCVDWPAPAGGATLTAGAYPDVPMLALSGGFDLRTPTAGAQSVVAQFPQGHLLVVPGIGHSVLTADTSFCADNAVRSWILDPSAPPPATCPRPSFIIPPLAAYPSASTPRHLGPAATFALAAKTLREAEAAWLLVDSAPPMRTVAGLYSGRVVPAGASAFKLVSYGIAPGVTLSGAVKISPDSSFPFQFDGAVTVRGASASAGVLGLVRNSLEGTLGGKPVR